MTRTTTCLALLLGWLGAFAAAAQEVTLPLERYEELRRRARVEPAKPAVPAALEEAVLDVEVGASSARLTQELVVDLYGDGWQRVELPAAGTFIEADFGGLEGRLEGGARAVLALRGEGRHRLRLVSVLPLTRDEGATRSVRRVEVATPDAAVVRGTVRGNDTADPFAEVETDGPVIVDASGERRSWIAAPGARFTLILLGAATVPERSRLPLRFHAVSSAVVDVARHRRQIRAHVSVEVRQGELVTLRATLPDGFEVVDVRGPIAGWDADGRGLTVTPSAAVVDALEVDLELVAGAADAFSSPVIEVEGAARVLLASKVTVRGDALLDLVDAGAGRQADRRDQDRLSAGFRQAAGLALVVPAGQPAPRWQLTWSDTTEVLAAQVDRLLVEAVVGENGRAAVLLWAEVRSRGAGELAVDLAGAELVAGRRGDVPVVPGRSPAGNAWIVPLAATAEKQVIHLAFLLPLTLPAGDGDLAFPLPALSAPVATVEARLVLPGGRRYQLADAGRAGRAGTPPRTGRVEETPLIARQLALKTKTSQPTAGVDALVRPDGFVTLEARWSALSSTPAPLRVQVAVEKSREEWF